MNLDDDARQYLYWDAVLTFDPTGSTPELRVDSTWHPMTWLGSPVAAGQTWTQTARTADLFAGPKATPGSAVVLTLGRHTTEPRATTLDGQIIPGPESVLDVTA